jgi:hypothetical protein
MATKFVHKPTGPGAGRCSGLPKHRGPKWCPFACREVPGKSASQFNTDLGDILRCRPPSFGRPIGSPFSTAGRWTTSRNQMRSRLPRFGSCLEKRHVFLLWIAERLKGSPRCEPLSSASRALWPGGSAFAAQGSLWARPRPGALGGALVMPMPRKTWSGPVLPPPKSPGVRGGHGILPRI